MLDKHIFLKRLFLLLVVYSEVWPICYCLGLGHVDIFDLKNN